MIIAVWGNAGSGKSTLAVKLAGSFAEKKNNVILVDTNYISPQVNIWYPAMNVPKEKSLSVLLDNKISTEEIVISKINIASDNIGVIGYAKDFAQNMMPSRTDTSIDLLTMLNKSKDLCDVVIVDCYSDIFANILSSTAILDIDNITRIIAVTPDLRGVSWYEANVRTLEENWRNNNRQIIKCFNQTHITSPVNDVENIIGTVDFYLPYDHEISNEMSTGVLGTHRKGAKKYYRIIDSIAQSIMPDEER